MTIASPAPWCCCGGGRRRRHGGGSCRRRDRLACAYAVRTHDCVRTSSYRAVYECPRPFLRFRPLSVMRLTSLRGEPNETAEMQMNRDVPWTLGTAIGRSGRQIIGQCFYLRHFSFPHYPYLFNIITQTSCKSYWDGLWTTLWFRHYNEGVRLR